MTIIFVTISIIALIALFLLTATSSALKRLHKRDSKKIFKLLGSFFFYRTLWLRLFPKDDYIGILFSVSVSQQIARFVLITSYTVLLFSLSIFLLAWPLVALILIVSLIAYFIFTDSIPKILGNRFPSKTLAVTLFATSPILLLCLPLTLCLILLSNWLWPSLYSDYLNEPVADLKHEIYEILQEAKISPKLSLQDKKLIESVVRFQSRVTREIMVPRIQIFAIDSETTIEEAGKLLQQEGYSRVPVYQETIDSIQGILMYKDILRKYMEFQHFGNDPKILQAPVATIVKPVMYTPETKKISNLLQDFRKRQMHLAIVVDEYGGTEGLVTIEDILEEIVGDIEDEYDDVTELYTELHDGSYVADARMTIIDAEQQLNVHIPQEGDYDTIGGYMFHSAGSIPSKGFVIKLDDVELEVLKSNDRRVEKVKIKKVKTEHE